jgi:hypothetical protein
VDTRTAAKRWADTWQRCWISGEPEPIAALYAPRGRYATSPFREPRIGPNGALAYLRPVFGEETDVRAHFGEPIVDGDRAAIQWWASLQEPDREVTYAGTSILRFDTDGLVADEWDSWNETIGRHEPPDGWGRAQ